MTTRTAPSLARGFTILEVVAVVVVMVILASVAIPAVGQVHQGRLAGAREEVLRRLMTARSSAMSTGQPTGVRFAPAANTTQIVVAVKSPASITAASTQWGTTEPVRKLSDDFPGVMLLGVAAAGAALTTYTPASVSGAPIATLWFGPSGEPQNRNESTGAYISKWTAGANVYGSVVLGVGAANPNVGADSSATIKLWPSSGMIE